MFIEMAYEYLSGLLKADKGLKILDFDEDGNALAVGRESKGLVDSVFFIQKEYGDTVIRLQVNGGVVTQEVQASRRFKKYWKSKTRFLEEQGVHLGIGDSSQFYFSVVTRTNLQDLGRLLHIESQLRNAVPTVAGEIQQAM